MIVSHKHRFIFFAVPKTATHALRQALTPHLGPDDWEQQVLFGNAASPIPEIARIQHGHVSARQLRPHVSDDVWESYFKFGFVRNPFDRFVSTCFFLNRNNPDFAAGAVTFMKRALTVPRFRQRVLVTPQVRLLTDSDGAIALDYVGRYEELQNSYDEICDRIGIARTELGRKNPSEHKAYTEYYDDELAELVGKFYEGDLKTFSYAFESESPRN